MTFDRLLGERRNTDHVAIQSAGDIPGQSERHLSPQVFQLRQFQHERSFKQPGCEDSSQGDVSLPTSFQPPLAPIPNAHHIEQPGYTRPPLQQYPSYGRGTQRNSASQSRRLGVGARRVSHASALLGSPARRGHWAQITQIFQNPEQSYRIENRPPIPHRASHPGPRRQAQSIPTFPREDTRNKHAIVYPHDGNIRNHTTPVSSYGATFPLGYQADEYRERAGEAYNTHFRYSCEQVASQPQPPTVSPLQSFWKIQDFPTPHTPYHSGQSAPLFSTPPTFSAFGALGSYGEIAAPRAGLLPHAFVQNTLDYPTSLPTSSFWSGDSEYLNANPAPRPRPTRSESTQPRIKEWLSKVSPSRLSPIRPPSPDPTLDSALILCRSPSLLSPCRTSKTSGSSQSWICKRGKSIEMKHRHGGEPNSPDGNNTKIDPINPIDPIGPIDVELVRKELSARGYCWWYVTDGRCDFRPGKICRFIHEIPDNDILSERELKYLRRASRTTLCGMS